MIVSVGPMDVVSCATTGRVCAPRLRVHSAIGTSMVDP